MSRILAKKIYQNGHIVFNEQPGMSIFISEQINGTPVTAWLVKNKTYPFYGGASEELTFKQPANDINVIKGVWLQWGQDACLIDGNVDDVAAKLGACCGDDATVTQNYAGGLPAYQEPVALTFTLVRTDDGSLGANEQALLDYSSNAYNSGNAIPGSFAVSSRDNGAGTTTYTFQAYEKPAPKNNTDTITETPLVFQSNTAPSLTGSNVFQLTGSADGDPINFKGQTTLSATVTALQADATLGGYGTWSTATSKIILTTTVKEVVTLVLGQEAP